MRLGHINTAGQRKGVDILMVQNLMVLSQKRSIQHAVVLSGDEDLREGIEYAQERGVRVAVVGIDASGDLNQSPELVREADQTLVLPVNIISNNPHRTPAAVPVALSASAPPPMSSSNRPRDTTAPTADNPFATHAVAFTHTWLTEAPQRSLTSLVEGRPTITRDIDAQMLRFVAYRRQRRQTDGHARTHAAE